MSRGTETTEPIPGIEQYSSSSARWAYRQEYQRVMAVLGETLMPVDIQERAADLAIRLARTKAELWQFRTEPVIAMANDILDVTRQIFIEKGWDPEPRDHNFAWHIFSPKYIHAQALQMAAEQGKLTTSEGLLVLHSGSIPELEVGTQSRAEYHQRQNSFFLEIAQRLGFPRTLLDEAYAKVSADMDSRLNLRHTYVTLPYRPFSANLQLLYVRRGQPTLIERMSIVYSGRKPKTSVAS